MTSESSWQRFISPATRLCIGLDVACANEATIGALCRSCHSSLPKCAACGHHIDAHEEGPCGVNHHESATGAECECLGFEE